MAIKNIKEFIRDMKLENTENFELNIDKNEFYGVKNEDMFLIGFNSLLGIIFFKVFESI